MQTLTTSTSRTPASIDMFTPAQTCNQLHLDEQALLDLVNAGHLAAYNFDGNIRFKVLDVIAATELLVAA